MLIAHRGLVTKSAKENTIAAFLGAIHNPDYQGFELDVYTSKDNIFVVHHSPLVDGKFIWHETYKDLKKKGLIKLEDVLKLKTSKLILIEIKDINLNINKFTKLLKKYRHQNLYVMSFFNSVIKKFINPPFKVGILNYLLNSTSSYTYDFIGIIYDIATPHLIASLKKANIEVFLYALKPEDQYIYVDVYYIIDDCHKH